MIPVSLEKMVLLGKAPDQATYDSYDNKTAACPEFYAIKTRLNATIISSQDYDASSAGFLERLLARSPTLRAVAAALRHRARFDQIYTTGEELGMALILGLKFTGWNGKVHMVVHACNSAKRRAALRLLGDAHVGTYICVSSTQANVLIRDVGLPRDKIRFWYNWIDTEFYDPALANARPSEDYIFACGLENRDYATLEAAAQDLPYQFVVQASGFFAAQETTHITPNGNFTVNRNKVPFEALRDLYAGARFVVTPLNAVDYAAGVTGLLEAMSMGKALIVTDSPGIRDYVVDGESAILVPPKDKEAMSRAISQLWADPDLCRRMGERNRQWCISNASVVEYADKVESRMDETARDGKSF